MAYVSDWATQVIELQGDTSSVPSSWGVAHTDLQAVLDTVVSAWGAATMTLTARHEPIHVWDGTQFRQTHINTWDGGNIF